MIITILLTLHELTLLPNGKLGVHFLDVGQGDSTLLITPSGKQVLVDGGPDMSTLEHLGKHMPFFDRTLDLVILTHPHDDHLASFPEVFKRYKVKRVLLAGTELGPSRYHALLNEITGQQIPVIITNPLKDIDLGDGVVLDVIWPNANGRNEKNPNNSSVVIRALYKEESILLTGDIEIEAEEEILVTGADLSSTILKVAHHGSKTSSLTSFLLMVKPEQAIISVGEENAFGHPHEATLSRFKTLEVPVALTASNSPISFEFR